MVASKRSIKFFLPYVAILVVILAFGWVFYWQHSKVDNSNKQVANLTTKTSYLNNEITNLDKTISKDTSKSVSSTTAPLTHKIGDTQCVNQLCITLDSFQKDPPGNSPDSNTAGTMLVSVQLTVANNGDYPASVISKNPYAGIFSGSMLYTSDNIFWTAFTGGVSGGTFVNQFSDYPKTGQTETGTLVFEIPSNETVDSYLYGNLTWLL